MTIKKDSAENAMERVLKQLIPAIGGLLVVVLGAYFVWFSSASISHKSEDWGTLGDYFGGLMNPLISFATLLVAYAVWKQQKEELRATKAALEEQAKTAEQQRREQRFFDLLNVYYRTLESLRFHWETSQTRATFQGKDAIQKLLSLAGLWAFTEEKGDYTKTLQPFAPGTQLALLRHKWECESAHTFGAYLRTMALILSSASTLLKDDHRTYVELLKAQLSDSELVLIGYHLVFDQTSTAREFLKYATQYELLSHLISGDLRSALEDHLPPEVFRAPPSGYQENIPPC